MPHRSLELAAPSSSIESIATESALSKDEIYEQSLNLAAAERRQRYDLLTGPQEIADAIRKKRQSDKNTRS